MQNQTPKRRKKTDSKVEFSPTKTFDVAEAKEDDFKLDLDAARYKARHGQGGTRRSGGPDECGLFNCPIHGAI